MKKVKIALEKMTIKMNKNSIILLDIKDIYPYVKIGITRKVVRFYSRGLGKYYKRMIDMELKMIIFRRKSTLLTFNRKYFKFRMAEDKEYRGTLIRGMDRVFVSYLTAEFILIELKSIYTNDTG